MRYKNLICYYELNPKFFESYDDVEQNGEIKVTYPCNLNISCEKQLITIMTG